jgi:hypothetical protein
MSIPSKDEIEKEKHKSTQFIRIESGNAIAEIWIKGNNTPKRYRLYDGNSRSVSSRGRSLSITIPPNTYHRIKNIGDKELKLYTIYSPPVH